MGAEKACSEPVAEMFRRATRRFPPVALTLTDERAPVPVRTRSIWVPL